MADVTDYTGLVTSEHADKPKFMAMVGGVAQAFVDIQNQLAVTPQAFDLDSAVSVQLDAVGLWVGVTRNVNAPLAGVYFSLDTSGLGFDQGVWQGPFDPTTGVVSLDDDTYRLLIRAKIGANSWDGTLGTSAEILNSIFNSGNSALVDPVSVTASGEQFGVGDGTSTQFQLEYQGQSLISVAAAQIYRNDWQGNQLLYATPRTNQVRWSGDVTQSTWGKLAGGTGAAPVATTAAAGSAPDGISAATRVVFDRGAGGTISDYSRLNLSSISTVVGQPYVEGVWVRSTDGVSTYTMQLSFNGASLTLVTVTPQWTFVTANLPSAADTTRTFRFDTQGGGVASQTADILMFGGMHVQGTATGSYIPTTAAAATLTDYTLTSSGAVTLAAAALPGAVLSWSGSGTIYPAGTYVFIQDNGDMSITYGIAGNVPSAIFLALLRGGYIPLKPEAVHINGYYVTSNPGGPLFGFDVENNLISGFDVGAWGVAA